MSSQHSPTVFTVSWNCSNPMSLAWPLWGVIGYAVALSIVRWVT